MMKKIMHVDTIEGTPVQALIEAIPERELVAAGA